MKAMIAKVALSILVFVLCVVIGISELVTHRVGAGVFTLLLGLSNLPLAWMHWYVYQKQKALDL